MNSANSRDDGRSSDDGRDNGSNGRDNEKRERRKTVAEEIDDLLDDYPDFDFYELPEEDFVMKRGFLRKGEGKLASQRHGSPSLFILYVMYKYIKKSQIYINIQTRRP